MLSPTQHESFTAMTTRNAGAAVRNLIAAVKNETTVVAHTPPGFDEPTRYTAKRAALQSVLGLNAETLPTLVKSNASHAYVAHVPFAAAGATSITLAAGIIGASCVAKAGANVIIVPDAAEAIPVGHSGIVAFQRQAGVFRTIDAAPFVTAEPDPVDPDDLAELQTSALPVASANLDWSQSITKGVRFEISRAMQKDVGEEILATEIILSAVLGIARAADQSLLTAITAATPGAFSLGAAAARGLRFDELRALVGSAGNGAAVGQDGTLRAAGVLAELTGDMAGTIVGSFARSAIAIRDDVTLHVERRNTRGDLVATCWAQLLPLVPDSSAFFSVGA